VAVGTYICTGEKAPAKRAVRDDCHSELACGAKQVDACVFDAQLERRVLNLECRDGVHSVSAAERRGRAVGQAEIFDLALSVIYAISTALTRLARARQPT
jgi:hypothetical protein